MKRILISIAAAGFAFSAQAQMPTLTAESGAPGGMSDVAIKNLAEVAASGKIAVIQEQTGKTLTKSILQVAQGKTDIAASPLILNFLMSRGLGPYSGLGKVKGKELAGNLRLLYPYHIAMFFLVSFQSTGIDSWEKLKGKTVFNGPPRGGALITARQVIRLTTGFKDGKEYKGKQIAWGQSNALFLDRSVDAAVRPGTIPAEYMPLYSAAGKINLVGIPKAKYEGAVWQKFMKAPGYASVVVPKKLLEGFYGKNVRVITDDDKFRTVANTAGDVVHKKMPKALAKKLTAAFIKGIPNLYKKVPFAKSQKIGVIDDNQMRYCAARIKMHPGAVEAWEEAGHKIPACAKP